MRLWASRRSCDSSGHVIYNSWSKKNTVVTSENHVTDLYSYIVSVPMDIHLILRVIICHLQTNKLFFDDGCAWNSVFCFFIGEKAGGGGNLDGNNHFAVLQPWQPWQCMVCAAVCRRLQLKQLIGHGVNCLVPVPNTLDRDVNMICLLQLDQCVNVDMK